MSEAASERSARTRLESTLANLDPPLPLLQDLTDSMADIPFDMEPYYEEFRTLNRRADGSRISIERDWPKDWALEGEEVEGQKREE